MRVPVFPHPFKHLLSILLTQLLRGRFCILYQHIYQHTYFDPFGLKIGTYLYNLSYFNSAFIAPTA